MNTQATLDELLDAAFSMRSVSYQRKVGDFENRGLIHSWRLLTSYEHCCKFWLYQKNKGENVVRQYVFEN
jgi:hypothetical protein